MKCIRILTILFIAGVSCENSEEHPEHFEQSGTPEVIVPKSDEILSFTEPDNDVNVYNPKACTLSPSPTLQEISDFYEWSDKHNRKYKNPQEKVCKMVRVVYHMREVKAHNELFEQGKVSFKRDLTEYSDLSHDEKFDTLVMKDVHYQPTVRQAPANLPELPPARECVDWRTEGLVSPAGSQKKCGSCYAWSGSAALEAQLRKCGISNSSVSVQLMVDCPTVGVWGCSSGWPYFAFKWQMNGGILPADKYPYKDAPGKCAYNSSDVMAYVDTPFKYDFTSVNGNASFIKQVVSSIGPVATVICVDKSLFQYSSGVYNITGCCKKVMQTVAIVGFGTDPKFGEYWIIKNSWGPSWGEKGFAKIARGNNLCITETQIQYAQVKDKNGKVCPLY